MTIPHEQAKALHLEGGNYFDDMRIDISESHRRLANLTTTPKSIKQPKYRNILKLYLTGLGLRFGICQLSDGTAQWVFGHQPTHFSAKVPSLVSWQKLPLTTTQL
jgi:hypothetical protein